MPTLEEARAAYPALMTYIEARSTSADWYHQLRADEEWARKGGLADVAAQLRQAQADCGVTYNSAVGAFLGLPINPANHEPPKGYYMASRVMHHHALGEALREAQALIAEGRTLRVTAARCRKTRKPIRFHTFSGPEQIQIEPDYRTVAITNGKVKGRLSSNWSVETTVQNLATALRTGAPYGETPANG